MKNKISRLLIAGTVGLIVAGLNFTAQAQSSIQGSIDFDGAATLNGSLSSATAFISILGTTGAGSQPTVIDGDQTLDYSSVPGGTPADFPASGFAFDGSESLPFQLWSFTVNSTTYSFEVNSLTIDEQNAMFLDIWGYGTAHIDGYSDTPGIFTISDTSANPNSVHVTFSSSANVVPEPATAGYFLLGLGALALTWRFRRSECA